MAKKTIITAAVTGAWPKKENNPNVPMTPQEIADDVYACWKAGAAIAHLHMRDDEGNGTMDTAKFEETVNLIHTKYPDCDIILNLTTSGDIHADDEIRVAHVKKLKPEMASYDCELVKQWIIHQLPEILNRLWSVIPGDKYKTRDRSI